MKRNRKLTTAGILDVVAGVAMELAGLGGCMNVINAGRSQDAWLITAIPLGVVAMIAGIRILDRKKGWAFALAGSLCAVPAVLGLVSAGIVASSKDDLDR